MKHKNVIAVVIVMLIISAIIPIALMGGVIYEELNFISEHR